MYDLVVGRCLYCLHSTPRSKYGQVGLELGLSFSCCSPLENVKVLKLC